MASFTVPMAIAAASTAASVASGVAQIAAGKAQAKAYAQQAAGARLQGEYVDIQADQAAAAAREQLSEDLGVIQALRGARGAMATGGEAVDNEVIRRGTRREMVEGLGFSAEKTSLLNEFEGYRASAKGAVLGGFGGAIGSFANAASSGSALYSQIRSGGGG